MGRALAAAGEELVLGSLSADDPKPGSEGQFWCMRQETGNDESDYAFPLLTCSETRDTFCASVPEGGRVAVCNIER